MCWNLLFFNFFIGGGGLVVGEKIVKILIFEKEENQRVMIKKKCTSSTCVGSEFTPTTGTLSSIKWLACKRVPSPPTVTTKSTSRIGRDKSVWNRVSHSTDFRFRTSWQKLIASLWTWILLSKWRSVCSFVQNLLYPGDNYPKKMVIVPHLI